MDITAIINQAQGTLLISNNRTFRSKELEDFAFIISQINDYVVKMRDRCHINQKEVEAMRSLQSLIQNSKIGQFWKEEYYDQLYRHYLQTFYLIFKDAESFELYNYYVGIIPEQDPLIPRSSQQKKLAANCSGKRTKVKGSSPPSSRRFWRKAIKTGSGITLFLTNNRVWGFQRDCWENTA